MAFSNQVLEDYLSAIKWEYKALAVLPEREKDKKLIMLQFISGWRLKLDDTEGAIKTSH